jgi:hypothetical protein
MPNDRDRGLELIRQADRMRLKPAGDVLETLGETRSKKNPRGQGSQIAGSIAGEERDDP